MVGVVQLFFIALIGLLLAVAAPSIIQGGRSPMQVFGESMFRVLVFKEKYIRTDARPLSHEFKAFLNMAAADPIPRCDDPKEFVEKTRAWCERVGVSRVFPSAVSRSHAGFRVHADWFLSNGIANASASPTILYFHGGGYIFCSVGAYATWLAALAIGTNVRVVAPEYRRLPEASFDQLINDNLQAYEDLLRSGVPANKVVLAGDSAGGGIVVHVLQRLVAKKSALPAAAIVISPWLRSERDCTGSCKEFEQADVVLRGEPLFSTIRKLVPTDEASCTRYDLAPLKTVPFYVTAGGNERLLDDSLDFAKKARAAGVSVSLDVLPFGVHVYPMFPDLHEEARSALKNISNFIHQHI